MIDIRKFGGEEERSAEIAESLREEFDVANRVFQYWAGIDVNKWVEKSTLELQVKRVSMMLAVQAARLFRSVLQECSRAEGLTAVILSRSLFETAVALEFVLAPVIRIKAVPAKKKSTDKFGNKRYYAEVGGNRLKPLTREFRANLFVASVMFQEQAQVQEVSSIPGLKRYGRSERKKIPQAKMAAIELLIGPKWTSILRSKPGYSGLSIEKTAKLMGKSGENWYRLGYPLQCRASHGTDAWKMFTFSEDGENATAFSSDSDVRFALFCGTAFFLRILGILDEHIGFEMKPVLQTFDAEASKLYKGVKS